MSYQGSILLNNNINKKKYLDVKKYTPYLGTYGVYGVSSQPVK